ncbi:MAG: hypothetical protein GY756_27030 [bacterium]|nr:hypothetical protein [bacterium]
MNAELELRINKRNTFLNFWNWYNGDDVNCEIIDGKLMLTQNDNEEELKPKEISLDDFVKMVDSRMKEIIKSTN